MEVYSGPNLSFANSQLSCDTFNIIHITDGYQLTKNELANAINYFKERNLAYCAWINDENLTESVQDFFSQLLLTSQGEEVGMLLDLDRYEPVESEKHQYIIQVQNQEQLMAYARVIAENWTPPDENVLKYYDLTSHYYIEPGIDVRLFVYYHHNQPVATLELFASDEDTVGIYGLATLEDTRGQGIGSALMTHALNESKRLNYKSVVLQASEDGIGIYRRLGFKDVTKYTEFA